MHIKEIIRNDEYGTWVILKYHEVIGKLNLRLYSDKEQITRWYKLTCGKVPDFETPKTFTEKLQVYKLKCHDPLMTKCADKYACRDYICQAGYGHLLNEVYGVYESVKEIDIGKLPEKFVLKATHGSGFNLIVRDKNAVNWKLWKAIMRSWLRQDIYWSGREWAYKDVPHRIIAEKYLEDSSGGLQDYKFYCFNGEPQIVQFDTGRYTKKHIRNFYDMNMKFLPLRVLHDMEPDVAFVDSDLFVKMKQIAADLSKPFHFARVDLYSVEDKIYCGEITFYPYGGKMVYSPEEYDRILGDLWDYNG